MRNDSVIYLSVCVEIPDGHVIQSNVRLSAARLATLIITHLMARTTSSKETVIIY